MRYFTEEHKLFRSSLREFLEREVRPNINTWEKEKKIPRYIWEKMGEMGFLGLSYPEEYGGANLDFFYEVIFNEEIGRMNSGGFAVTQQSVQYMASPYIFKYGSSVLKAKYLPGTINGKLIGCIGITEPDAGSDPASMKTVATKTDGGYKLSGSKTWITNSPIADVLIIWAKDEQGVLRGFIVERDVKGLDTPYLKGKFALRASATGMIFLDNVFVPEDKVLPDVQSFRGPFTCLNSARYGIAWGAIGAAEFCWSQSLSYTLDREQFGKPLASKQLIQKKLADMQTEITLGLQAALRVGRLIDEGKMKPSMISLVKRNNCGKALDIARAARDIHGGNGVTDEYHVIRHCMNLEAVNTYEGTHDIHALILGQEQTGISAFN